MLFNSSIAVFKVGFVKKSFWNSGFSTGRSDYLFLRESYAALSLCISSSKE